MFLIDIIKPNAEKKYKTCFIFLRNCLGEGSRESTNLTRFVSFRVWLGGCNKKLYSKQTRKYYSWFRFDNIDHESIQNHSESLAINTYQGVERKRESFIEGEHLYIIDDI